jgi:hypothetical protein
MKLAKKAFIISLTIMALIFTVSAQTLRSEKDPRNIAPTVGTGGPVGGPTGLFTVYDGQTLRKGEFTFSAAYSNFDRDPGNADFVEIPISFQVGLSDNLELFFNTDAYRGVKVNSPRNLSGFYLPNATFFNGPAMVLAPAGTNISNTALFRPTGNQPFVQFPFVGGNGGTWGYDCNFAGNAACLANFQANFGAPLGQYTLQNAIAGGAVNNFPGIGSVYGGILPGVVLQTVALPAPAFNGINAGGEAPTVFALAPSYLPDAPFIGRGYGESAFSTFTVGAKWRFTGPNNPVGVGIIPFYRFYADNADDLNGFTQLQRGASPGGNRGDFGLVGFADARLRKWVNVSANVGYIYNSDVEGTVGGQTVTLLDRGDELIAGIGVDFPVNKYFQPIAEIRSLQYVGGRTPNAFENNPIDALAGVRIFPRRWVGVGVAYRYHVNQQGRGTIPGDFTGTANIVGNNNQNAIFQNTFNGVPPGFRTSTDPHGFIVQGWIGRRNARQDEIINQPAVIDSVNLSATTIKLPCTGDQVPVEGETCSDDQTVNIRTSASDPENDVLTYNYTVSGGRITGQGANVTWDLSGVQAGTYTVTVGIDDGCGVCSPTKTETVTVEACNCKDPEVPCECPTVTVTPPPAAVNSGETMTFTANVAGGSQSDVTYEWSVDKGSIISGQGTASITVGTDGLNDETVTATVKVGGLCENCETEFSDAGIVSKVPEPVLVDEFGPLANNDVKNRLDNFFVELNNDPNSTGYIINYGSARDVARRERLIKSHITFRSFPASRIVFVNGGVEPQIRTKLWRVPAGADSSTIDE